MRSTDYRLMFFHVSSLTTDVLPKYLLTTDFSPDRGQVTSD